MPKDLLLEIGTEELPPRFIPSALHQLQERIEKGFTDNHIEFKQIYVCATPRRLVVKVKELGEAQQERVEKIYGPPQKLAYDENGNPTDKAKGFAAKYGLDVGALKIEEISKKGCYVVLERREKGEPSIKILKKLLPDIILSLQFPKSMKWGCESISFGRPIRWLLCLFGSQSVSFSLGSLTSGTFTYGHPVLSPGPYKIQDAEWSEFRNILRDAKVIVDDEERKGIILKEIQRILHQNEILELDESLLAQIIYSVENPNAILGEFTQQFLDLPEEVLVTVMKEQLSFIPLRNREGKLLPKFIAISNGDRRHGETIKRGYTRVLHAKLYDAQFFFQEDTNIPLEDRVKELETVIFHEKLGTYRDKTERIMKLAEFLSDELNLSDHSVKVLKRSAYLCKADQLCEMVKELPSLEGIIGGKYAYLTGETQEVALTIEDHYLPTFNRNILPRSLEGRLLSLMDKIDSITGYFTLGLKPTSTSDPYGVRRDTIGILLNLIGSEKEKKGGLHLSMERLLNRAMSLYEEKLKFKEKDSHLKEIKDYLNRRFKNILLEKGIRYDIVDATTSVGTDDYCDCYLRAKALENLRKQEGFEDIITPFKRTVNILKQAREKFGLKKFGVFQVNLVSHRTEKKLWDMYQKMEKLMKELISNKRYPRLLKEISSMRKVVDEYFDNVLVMDTDEGLRNNHLALLNSLSQFFSPVADFSMIAGEPAGKEESCG
ncbi:MAG TPA: glycine--tRNA ligase subunit beta [Candidatus Omnitrophica bacterium]|nr:glycine--tRNA ligase subunit beta [Candidatus Omnitrophota bacterium]